MILAPRKLSAGGAAAFPTKFLGVDPDYYYIATNAAAPTTWGALVGGHQLGIAFTQTITNGQVGPANTNWPELDASNYHFIRCYQATNTSFGDNTTGVIGLECIVKNGSQNAWWVLSKSNGAGAGRTGYGIFFTGGGGVQAHVDAETTAAATATWSVWNHIVFLYDTNASNPRAAIGINGTTTTFSLNATGSLANSLKLTMPGMSNGSVYIGHMCAAGMWQPGSIDMPNAASIIAARYNDLFSGTP